MTHIETERLHLRPLTLADAPAIQHHFPHWNIVQHLSAKAIKWPYPADGAQKFLQNIALPAMATREQWYFGITRRDDPAGEVIGVVHLRRDASAGNIGFWLSEDHQGRGYMKEATTALHNHAFEVLGFDKLMIMNAGDNTASRKLREKTGAVLKAVRPADHYLGGSMTQEVWELTSGNWYARDVPKILFAKPRKPAPHRPVAYRMSA